MSSTSNDRRDQPSSAKKTRNVTLALLAALCAIASSCPRAEAEQTHGDDIIKVDVSGLAMNEGDTVITCHSALSLVEFEATDTFRPPYRLRLTSAEGDTVLEAHINVPSIPVSAEDRGGCLEVISADGRVVRLLIAQEPPEVPWCAVIAIMAIIGASIGSIWYFLRRQRKKLEERRQEIEDQGRKHTRKYNFATVLFTDIQGFTRIAEHLNPEQLVDELDRYFIYFDELVDRYGVEKIKTIGDAYMCAGGVPDTDSANPIEVTLVGLGMIDYVNSRRAADKGFWNIRVGINTGPVVSAHLGNIKRAFDIWGDTVNTASRMESGGEPGRVNVSDNTYQKIRDYFECEYRGKMPVKYKGEIDMYFVNRLKEEYCVPGTTCQPNQLLLRKMQILRIHDFEQRVRDTLLKDAHPNTTRRMDAFLARVSTLYTMERMTDEEVAVCGVSAIFIFVKLNFPKDSEISGKTESGENMRKMHLTDAMQETVRRVVQHVIAHRTPEDRMEEVLCDALNEIYGHKDIIPLLFDLYDEKVACGQEHHSRNAWLVKQREQIAGFSFYTDSARRLSEVPKSKQIEAIDMIMTL